MASSATACQESVFVQNEMANATLTAFFLTFDLSGVISGEFAMCRGQVTRWRNTGESNRTAILGALGRTGAPQCLARAFRDARTVYTGDRSGISSTRAGFCVAPRTDAAAL